MYRKYIKSAFCVFIFSFAGLVFSQGVPESEWTPEERKFISSARQLYLQQGITYSDMQAAEAVGKIRQKNQLAERGIPEKNWSPEERAYVNQIRRQSEINNLTFTDEQARMTVASMREQIAKLMGTAGALQNFQKFQSQGQQPEPQLQSPAHSLGSSGQSTEEAVAAQLQSSQGISAALDFRGRRDGFDINSRPVIDSEGPIFSYAFDVISGDVTYAVKTTQGVSIKTLQKPTLSQPIVIATGRFGQGGWEMRTSSGKTLGGSTLTVLSNGFLVGRDTAAFRYIAGRGVQNIAIPEGYFITPLQRGNVGSTGYVLVEKMGATGSEDSLSQLLSSVKSIGSIIGAVKKSDYALMDIGSGKLYELNISANGRLVTVMSECRRRNWMLSECQRAQTFESVYGADGAKNSSHYYWRVDWVRTPKGPVAFTLEDGLAKLYITDLSSGKKVVGFERSLGIADWQVSQNSNGNVAVKAKLAFDWNEIDDVVNFLASNQTSSTQQ